MQLPCSRSSVIAVSAALALSACSDGGERAPVDERASEEAPMAGDEVVRLVDHDGGAVVERITASAGFAAISVWCRAGDGQVQVRLLEPDSDPAADDRFQSVRPCDPGGATSVSSVSDLSLADVDAYELVVDAPEGADVRVAIEVD